MSERTYKNAGKRWTENEDWHLREAYHVAGAYCMSIDLDRPPEECTQRAKKLKIKDSTMRPWDEKRNAASGIWHPISTIPVNWLCLLAFPITVKSGEPIPHFVCEGELVSPLRGEPYWSGENVEGEPSHWMQMPQGPERTP